MAIRRRRRLLLWICVIVIGLLPLTSLFLAKRTDLDLKLQNGVVDQIPDSREAIRERGDKTNRKWELPAVISTLKAQQQQQQQQQQQDQKEDERRRDGGPYVELYRLLDQMDGDWHFWWIRKRIQLLWPEFEAVAMQLNNGCRNHSGIRRQVLILPGVLQLTNFARPEVIRSGGPLGELIQWADLIAACHALCHKVLIRTQFASTIAQLRADAADESEDNRGRAEAGCSGSLDFIYTDISGFRALPDDVISAYRHKFRIADAFGTEAEYNDPEYAVSHGNAINRWGMLDLRLKQFYTLYPHTPDNSFLGFVISRSKVLHNATKENYALIMGKEAVYLEGKMELLRTINEIFPLRATMSHRASHLLPPGAETLGIIDSSSYQELLQKAKVCVGLGDPVESPGSLEAIAQGCVFLNPRRKGDRVRLSGKPTSRQVNSQVPYLEEYVGPPYSYTIDDNNLEELRSTLETILKQESQSMLPLEFSVEGFLQRLQAYTTHQDLCKRPEGDPMQGANAIWPPMNSLQVEIAPVNTSCKKACFDKGLVCEPVYFPILNSAEYLSNATGLSCSSMQYDSEIYSPTYFGSKKLCSLQQRSQLFSCAGGELVNAQRICPCRDFIPFQLALCKQCT